MADVIQVDAVVGAKEGTLRVWWIRNAPSPAEYWIVADVAEAKRVLGDLERHDARDSRIITNVGGLEMYEESLGTGEWFEWSDENGVDIEGFLDDKED